MAMHLIKLFSIEASESVRRSESVLNNGMLEQRGAILSIILSILYIKCNNVYKD
jgi:hypothetical protein